MSRPMLVRIERHSNIYEDCSDHQCCYGPTSGYRVLYYEWLTQGFQSHPEWVKVWESVAETVREAVDNLQFPWCRAEARGDARP